MFDITLLLKKPMDYECIITYTLAFSWNKIAILLDGIETFNFELIISKTKVFVFIEL